MKASGSRGTRPRRAEDEGGERKRGSKALWRLTFLTHAHFSGPPAMPITRLQPTMFLAIWTAALPVAPAAPEMTTVCSGLTCPTSCRPQ